MAPRIPFTDLLCVYCPIESRAYVFERLRDLHPGRTVTALADGWLVVESSLGAPQSPLIGSHLPVRFAVGEHELLGPHVDVARAAAISRLAVDRPEELGQLPGDFAFIVLGEQGVATVVRPCSGIPRLFTFHRTGVTAVGTRLEWVAQVFPEALALDARRLACDDHALGIAPDHTSAIAGVTIVPVGHVAHVGRWHTPRLTQYWSLSALPEVRLTADALAAEVAQRLRQELSRHLASDRSNAVLFSGGLDSSLLTALCAEAAVVVDGVTILPPPGHPALTRERYYARSLTPLFREHVVRQLDADWLLNEAAAHPGSLCPVVSSEWQTLPSLRAPPQTVITGWFADECFGHLRLPELFRRTLPRVAPIAHTGSSLIDATVMWYRRRRAGRFPFQTEGLATSPLFSPAATREFAGWLRATTWMPRPELPTERLTLHRRLTDIGGAYAEAAAHIGARTIAPFASRSVVELAAQLDPAHLFHHGVAKTPLRTLAQRLLPRAHSERPDKGDWGLPQTVFPSPHIPPELARVLDMDYLQAHPTLSLDEVGTLLWVTALERGRVRIEHDRKAIWKR